MSACPWTPYVAYCSEVEEVWRGLDVKTLGFLEEEGEGLGTEDGWRSKRQDGCHGEVTIDSDRRWRSASGHSVEPTHGIRQTEECASDRVRIDG